MREQKNVQNKFSLLSIIFVSLSFLVLSLNSIMAAPYGATVTPGVNSTAILDTPTSNGAYAGNITSLNIFGFATTMTWAGYFGNVTGVIQLADVNDYAMYNWSDVNPRGEVYASTNSSIEWNYIECFNFFSDGTYTDDTGNKGGTSQFGTNLTQLEIRFNISSDDPDGIDTTFIYNSSTGGGHPLFYTNNLQFDIKECASMKIIGNGTDGFDEILMYEPVTRSVVFNSIVKRDAPGFDGNQHDFQMLVLDDGHATDLLPTDYYFYLELGA